MTQIARLEMALMDADGVNPVSDDRMSYALEMAQDIINETRCPYGDYPETLERRYHGLQIRIAVELINKEGVEGQTSHTEDGVTRSYSSADVSPELLAQVTPRVGVF